MSFNHYKEYNRTACLCHWRVLFVFSIKKLKLTYSHNETEMQAIKHAQIKERNSSLKQITK